jgi:hypothetical protein
MRVVISEIIDPPVQKIGLVQGGEPRFTSITDVAGDIDDVAELLDILGHTPDVESFTNVRVGDDPLGLFRGLSEGGFTTVAKDDRADLVTRERLEYLPANSVIPNGVVSSTARKGGKWLNKVDVGDVVDLVMTGSGEVFGQAAIVCVEYLPLRDVIENAAHNHVGHNNEGRNGRVLLLQALEAAYGALDPNDKFTVLHILPLNQAVA